MTDGDAGLEAGDSHPDIALTDYEDPQFCSGCEEEFEPEDTMWVADFGSAFPAFCSEECAFEEAKKYRIEHLTDDRDGTEFVRLVEAL